MKPLKTKPRRALRGEPLEARRLLDATVVFNEIMYNPAGTDESLEFVELHNQMAVDMDISAWRFSDGIEFTFPEGTIVPGGGYLVVASSPQAFEEALGPFTGRLSNGGEQVELRDRNDRLMNAIDYGDAGQWPVAADGSGASLAKIDPNSASEPAENWASSVVTGGTPGRRNFPDPNADRELVDLIALDAAWRYDANDALPAPDWADEAFDDSAWPTGDAVFFAGSGQLSQPGDEQIVGVTATASSELVGFDRIAAYTVDGSGMSGQTHGIAPDGSMWLNQGTFAAPNDVAPEITFDLGQEQAVSHMQVWNYNELLAGRPELLDRGIATADVLTARNDGVFSVLIADQTFDRAPGTQTDFSQIIDLGGTVARFVKIDVSSNHEGPIPNPNPVLTADNFAGLSEVQFFKAATEAATELPLGPSAYYFRTEFSVSDDPARIELLLTHGIDDGAVFYINGVEIHRHNMPEGAIAHTTAAETAVGDPSLSTPLLLGGEHLRLGTNVLAVEVHQSGPGDPDMVFAAELSALVAAAEPDVVTTPVGFNDAWRHESSGADLGDAWRAPGFDDSAWGGGAPGDIAPYFAAEVTTGDLVTDVTAMASSEYTVEGRLAANVVNGSGLVADAHVTSPVSGTMWLNHGLVLSPADPDPEITFDLGSEVAIDSMRVWNYNESLSASCCTNFGIAVADILVAGDDMNFTTHRAGQTFDEAPGAETDFAQSIDLGGVVARYVKFDVDTSSGIANHGDTNGFVGLSEVQFFSGGGEPQPPQLPLGPVTYYFRNEFEFSRDPTRTQLTINTLIDDGAVFYLNDVEIHRQNMPAGAIAFDTPATTAVGDAALSGPIAVPADALQTGTNVLAVEVHGTGGGDTDMRFDVQLTATTAASSTGDVFSLPLAINETAPGGSDPFWIELINTGATSLDLDGYVVASSNGATHTLAGLTIDGGAVAVVDQATLGFSALAGDRIYVYTPGETAVVTAAKVGDRLRGRMPDGTMGFPDVATPGAANSFALHNEIVINEIMYHHRPDPGTPGSPPTPPTYDVTELIGLGDTWRFNDTGEQLLTGWQQSAHAVGGNWSQGLGLIGYEEGTVPAPGLGTTLANPQPPPPEGFITTYYFETDFNVTAQILADLDELQLRHVIDDGAVFYLNGNELTGSRFNMTAGAFDATTFSDGAVGDATLSDVIVVSANDLTVGTNRFSAEVHQQGDTSSDVMFGVQLSAAVQTSPGDPGTPATPITEIREEWIELFNRSTTDTIDLSGWELDDGIGFEFPPTTQIEPGGFLIVAEDAVTLREKYPAIAGSILGDFSGRLNNENDRIVLKDAAGNTADVVQYFEGGRWPAAADGDGSSLELRDPDADNALPSAWAASVEDDDSTWQTYSYQGVATASSIGPDGQWQEFVMGLLDAGEVLLDDISVVEDPNGAATQLIQNGSFDGDALGSQPAAWRNIGNHRHSEVVVDPDNAANRVLHLVATGPTEHMHNHAETTLAGGAVISNNTEYAISFKAKWVTGVNQFHTRLYFNRLAHVTVIERPELHGTPGAPNSRLLANLGPTYDALSHSPAVPLPGEPVTVSAAASDPDGVAATTLYYSVNSGAFSSVAMSDQGDGVFAGTLPGQDAGTIVQFYVEGADGLGATTTFPRAGAESRALYTVDDGLAATNGLHNLRIILTPDDADYLHTNINLMSNDRLPATIIYDESEIFYNAGVRLSGSEHARPYTNRLSFSVRFNADQLFRGVHHGFTLDRSESTGFGQQEILTHHVMNHAGGLPGEYNDLVHIITPQIAHTGSAEMQLARYSDIFLDSQFQSGSDGMLFEYEIVYHLGAADAGGNKIPQEDGATGVPIGDMGDGKERYRWTYLIKNNRARDDYERLIEFAKAMGTGGAAFNEQIGDVIDVDQWLRAFALGTISGAGDNYSANNTHNAQFYVRPEDDLVLYFPHDLDAFLSATRPLAASGDLQKLIAVPERAHMYYGHVDDILTTTYNTSYMSYWTDHFGSLLPAQNFAGHLSFIGQRNSHLTGQIFAAAPNVSFAISTNGGADFTVDDSGVTLGGTGWVNVRELRLAGSDEPLATTWPGVTDWQVTLPVAFGANPFTLEAYDFQGNLIASDSITVTSTVSERPVLDFLRITEVNYHPHDPTTAELLIDPTLDEDDFEFIELQNTSETQTLDLTGVRLTDGVTFDFTGSAIISLGPGQFVLVVRSNAGMAARYGAGLPIAGEFQGGTGLRNSGETIQLQDADNAVVHDFAYDDEEDLGWPKSADGDGPSLVVIRTNADYNLAESWYASPQLGGTPGAAATGAVIERFVFYDNSAYDTTSDDDAIVPDKSALRPGQTATLANYTNVDAGINGVMFDIAHATAALSIDENDVLVWTGNGAPPTWASATAPTVAVRPGEGRGGSDRVVLTWPDGTIRNTWLRVDVQDNSLTTNLAAIDEFYFGNAVGETGNDPSNALVTAADLIAIRDNTRGAGNRATIVNRHDVDRDRHVNATDALLARNNATGPFSALRLITPPLPSTAPPEAEGEALLADSVPEGTSYRPPYQDGDKFRFVITRRKAARATESSVAPSLERAVGVGLGRLATARHLIRPENLSFTVPVAEPLVELDSILADIHIFDERASRR